MIWGDMSFHFLARHPEEEEEEEEEDKPSDTDTQEEEEEEVLVVFPPLPTWPPLLLS